MSGGGSSEYEVANPDHVIKYAPYVESWHQTFLNTVHVWCTNPAYAANPYTSAVAYDPEDDIDAMLAALNALCNALLAFHNTSVDINVVATAYDKAVTVQDYVPRTALQAHMTAMETSIDAIILNEEKIDESVNQYSEQLQADIEEKALPIFESGMRDINAVMSSAFIIGEALIFAEKDRNVAKFSADLRLANWSDRNKAIINSSAALTEEDIKLFGGYLSLAESVGKFFIQGTEYKRLLTQSLVDVLRMKIVAFKEETDENLRIQDAKFKWYPMLTQYMASMIGSAGGGHAVPAGYSSSTGSNIQTALGGVMAGASIGAMFNGETGGMWGSAIGGILGGAASLL